MSLTPGTRLGPYEITAKLGEGGMGEVWRATDSRLKREVAIKALPAMFTADPERLARFEREAQLLAQLHHPNIAAIFGLEEFDGVRALVMELVEGPTLAERLERGAVPLEETYPIARQIAEALEAAHEKGIVHRDLKPANVKLTADGNVKVLDFGLAKAMDPIAGSSPSPSASPTLMNSPTLTAAGTQLGAILGTAAYMAPEQARGGAIDKRADIWAFGVLLYEMLAGERLFDGESVVDTVSAVMRKEIDLRRLPASTPRRLRELVRRCLERSPKNRLHDIADARIVLDELARGMPDEVDPSPAAAPGLAVAPRHRGRTAAIVLGVGAVALLAGLGLGQRLPRAEPAAPGAGARWALAIPDGLALSTDAFPELAISEDGRLQVAVVVDSTPISHLLLRSSDELEPRVLPDTEGAAAPFFSPDGKWIGFFRARALYKIPTAGGPPVELAAIPSVLVARGGTWSRDGFIYFSPNTNTGLSRVAESGGPVTPVTQLDPMGDERTHRWAQALPDGSAVLFTNDSFASIEYYDDARIEAVRPATGERKVLVEGSSQARYATGGHLIFARGGSLYAIDFDPRTLTVHGSPQLVAQGIATDVGSGAVQFALSAGGAAFWAPGGLYAHYHLAWVDRHGNETPVAIPPAPFNEAELSPDGKRVALVGGAGGVGDLWVADLERGAVAHLTSGEAVLNPVWSPDGTRIAYVVRSRNAQRERRWKIAWKSADGSREAETLFDSERFLSPSGFTNDGQKLLFSWTKPDATQGADLYLLPVAGARTPELLLGGAYSKRDAVVSPDGRFLAYTATEGELPSVFVRPFPSGEGRWQISTPYGFEPRWGRDQKELFYRTGSAGQGVAGLYRVTIDTSARTLTVGKPELLFDRISNAGIVHTFNVSPDGRRFFTPRSPEGRGSLRTVYLDLGFARRIAASHGGATPP